ncbi:class I SAM-dependent methyltransferase [Vitellibacter sp. q18]|nr:class I SAM-dependent methyltransferase [Aequorivita lutea]
MEKEKKIYLSTKDYLVTGKNFDLILNPEWQLLETIPKPDADELGKYYESSEYISHTDDRTGIFSRLYQLVKNWSLRKKVSIISEQNGSIGSVLDIGAGTGDFLKYAKSKGWDIYGVEPNNKASSLAFDKGVALEPNLEDFECKKFDVITLWHVLEHLPDLEENISKITSMLKPNGSLIIAVPNFRSYDAYYYGKYWAAFDVPRHLWHFSRESINLLFSSNFTIEKIEPMFFDSFYVSLLSEKYKSGRAFSIRAIWVGFVSNLKALRSKEYSSLIYCLRKLN